jgi:hypothetical protein
MIDDSMEALDWCALEGMLKDIQERLDRIEIILEKRDEMMTDVLQLSQKIKVGTRLDMDAIESSLGNIEGLVRETAGRVKSMNAKLDLIIQHLGVECS